MYGSIGGGNFGRILFFLPDVFETNDGGA